MNKVSKVLYTSSRKMNKVASTINDIEILLSGDPKKIMKRAKRKTVGKTLYKINREIMKRV